jgi:peptide/nickel transport system substrate-binding protein
VKDGVRFTIRVVVDGGVEFNQKAAEILKEQFAQVGVRLELQIVERNVMLDRVYIKRDFDTQIHVFSTGADPAIDVARLYISSNIRNVNFTNGSAYRNAKVDELFSEGQSAFRTEDRARAYREAQMILVDELPCIWLVESGIVGVWNKKFHGPHTWSAYSYYTFWDVWTEDGK